MANDKPADFSRMIAGILPKEGNIELNATLPITGITRTIVYPPNRDESDYS